MNNSSISSFPRALSRPLLGFNRRRRWLILLPLLLMVLVGVLMYGFSARYSSRIFPGVEAMGLDLGGMTAQQASAALQDRVRADLERPVRFQLRTGGAQVSAQELGLSLDAAATAERALQVGRSGGWADRWAPRFTALKDGSEIAPIVHFKKAKAAAVLQELARSKVDRPVRDAALALTAQGPEIRPAQVGFSLDVPATLRRLPSSLESLYAQQEPVGLVVREARPSVTDQQLVEVAQAVELAWSNPLNVAFQGRSWVLPVERVRDLLSLQGGGAQVRPQVDEAALRSWVMEVAGAVNRDPRDAQVKVSPGSVELVPGQEGYELDTPDTVAAFSSAILAGAGRAEPVVQVITPDITDQELTRAVADADQMVSRPLSLEMGSKRWSLDPSSLTNMLRWRGAGEIRRPYLDPAPLGQWVNSVAADVYTPPMDARIEVTDAGVRVIPDRAGVEVAAWKTVKALEAATLDPTGRVPAATRRIPADVVAADLRDAAAEANRLVGSPVQLTLGDSTWTADAETLREWLRWSGEGAKQAPYISADEMAAFVSSIESEIYQAPSNAYVTIESGLPELVSEQEGIELDTAAALALLDDLTRSEQRSAQLPTVTLSPDVRVYDLQAEYELMSSWTSNRLYLKLGELTWWLDPEDIIEAVWWNSQGGTELSPYLSVDSMEQRIRLFVTEPPDTIIDYRATAEDAVAALEDGYRTVEITSRHIRTPSSPHIGDEARWAGKFPDKWIDLNLTTQSIAAYEGGKQVRVSLITSGRPELATPTGLYSVMDKLSPYTFISPWPKGHKWWYPTADANFALRFRHGGLYIHDAPWRSVYGPGTNGSGRSGAASTGSHGCVNVPYEMMAWLYGWSAVGTPIVIHD